MNNTSRSFQTILELIHGSLDGCQVIQHSLKITSTMTMVMNQTRQITQPLLMLQSNLHDAMGSNLMKNSIELMLMASCVAHFCCNY